MKPRILLAAAISTLLILGAIFAAEGVFYVRTQRESLKTSPDGENIGQLLQKAEIKVIEEKGDWVKVGVTGWIPKSSITGDLASIKDVHKDKIPAGSGFFYSNTSITAGPLGTQCVGEMTNNSDRDYTLVNFILSVYAGNEELLGTAYINISNFAKGDKKSFQGFLIEIKKSQIASFKIQFENGL